MKKAKHKPQGMRKERYKVYRRRLLAFAKLMSVRVKFLKHKPENSYSFEDNMVYIDETLKRDYLISTLAHELGHFMDFKKNPARYKNRHHWDGRNRDDNSQPLTRNQKNQLFQAEVRAWKQGEALLRMLKIPINHYFRQDRVASLNTYRAIRVIE